MTAGETSVNDGNPSVMERAENRTETDMSDEEEAHEVEATVQAGVVAAAAAVERAENESTIRGEVSTGPKHHSYIHLSSSVCNRGVSRHVFKC